MPNTKPKAEFTATCRNLRNGRIFKKEFYNYDKIYNFAMKCKYSRKVKILYVEDIFDRGYDFYNPLP